MTDRACDVLLKARPTRAQLADRLADPVPPGLELYLDARDVGDLERLQRLAVRLNDLRPGPDFAYVVEGPLRSIDGAFFDISANSDAQRECVRRICWLAREVRAEAVLVHAIAPRKLGPDLTEEAHLRTLEASLPFVRSFVDTAEGHDLIPMLENIPPVARQREAAYMCTPVGMRASDLAFFADRFPGLKVTVDVSHAQLFLNGLRMDGAAPKELAPLVRYLTTVPDEPTMDAYLSEVEPHLFEAHISNARGILEEGLPYGDGDLDLDALAVRLSRSARHLVTETIEPDADRGTFMREAQSRLEAALERG